MKSTCPACGHVHASNDARAVGLFSPEPTMYVAATAGTPARATRAEAEADECAGRQGRRNAQSTDGAEPDGQAPSGPSASAAPEQSRPVEQPFPAALMETAARAKAWRDFLAQVHFSLMVWQLDGEVRDGCEHVLAWLRACRDDLSGLGAAS